MALSLGQLIVSLGLDSAEFISGMTKSEQQAKRFAANLQSNITAGVIKAEIAMKALGAAASFAVRAFPELVEQAAKMQDLAEIVGDAADRFASLSVSAKIGGTDMQAVADASVKLSKNLVGVDDESKASGAALKALGLNIADIKKLSPSDQFEAIAKALSSFEDGTSKAAVATALFGKQGAALLPFLKELAEGTGRVNILTAEQIKLADEFADRQAKSRAQLNLYAQAFAVDMIPALTAFTEAIVETGKELVGVDQSANKLKGNTGVRDFALEAARVLSYVADAADGSARALLALGSGVYAAGRIVGAAAAGGISAAAEEAERERDFLKALLDGQLIGAKIRAQIGKVELGGQSQNTEDAREAARFARQAAQGKKKLTFNGVDENAGATLKARLDGQIKLIHEFAQAQKAELDFANELARNAYEDGNTSLRDSFEQQQAIRQAELQVELKALDDESSKLKAARAQALKPQDQIELDTKITEVAAKRAAAVTKYSEDEVRAHRTVKNEAKSLGDTYNELTAQILALSGDEFGAAQIRIAKQVADARKLLTQDEQDPKKADDLGRLLTLAAQRNKVQTDYGRLVESARIQEEQAQLAARLGGKSEMETLQAIGTIRQNALGDMKELADQAARLAQELGTPEAKLFADQLALGLAKARAEADPLFQKIRDIGVEVSEAMGQGLEDWVTGAKNFNDALKDVEAQLIKIVTRLLITKPFENWMSNVLGGNGTSDGGGGIIGSFFSSILGGGRALGGPVEAGGMYPVNERGPELLDVNGRQFLMMGNQRGRVMPAGSGGEATNIVINQSFAPGTSTATVNQAAARAADALRRSSRNR